MFYTYLLIAAEWARMEVFASIPPRPRWFCEPCFTPQCPFIYALPTSSPRSTAQLVQGPHREQEDTQRMAARESRCLDEAEGASGPPTSRAPTAAEPVAAGACRHVPAFQSLEEGIQPGMASRDEISRWPSLEPTCLLHDRPEAHPGSKS